MFFTCPNIFSLNLIIQKNTHTFILFNYYLFLFNINFNNMMVWE